MAAAPSAPADNAPPEWNADPDPIEEAPAAPQGALAPKREAAKAKKGATEKANEAPPPPGGLPEWNADPDSTEEPAPPPAPAPPPSKAHVAAMGIGKAIDDLGAGGGMLAGGVGKLLDKVSSSFMPGPGGTENTDFQDFFFKHAVDPNIARSAEQNLGPDASTADKATWGVAHTLAQIAEFFLGGPLMGAPEAGGALTARVMGGIASAQVPAASSAIDVGRTVLDATGDKRAAAKAAVTTYATVTGMALVPPAVGRGLPTRAATGAVAGAGLGEVQRRVQNAAMPENMQEEADPLNTTLNAVMGAAVGVIPHGGGTPPVEERAHTIMETAQADAAKAAKDAGGDGLDQVVAATHANATVGAEHDAAAVHQTRIESAKKAAMDELENAQAAQEELQKEQDFGAAERQAGKAPAAPGAEEGFAAREAEQAKAAKKQEGQKERDFVPAKNQAADQDVAQAEAAAEKGGAAAPPTLADALPPEQVNALQALRDKLAAQKPAEAPEPSVVDRMRAQAKGTEDDFQELPPETPKATTKAPEPAGEEELPEGGPPPVKPADLAARRQAALDAAMAAKVRGKPGEATQVKGFVEDLAKNDPGKLKGWVDANEVARIRAGDMEGQPLGEMDKRLKEEKANVQKAFDENTGGALAERRANARPPLQQGTDPAEALFEEQVKRDADAAEAARAAEEKPAPISSPAEAKAPPNRMAAIRAAAEKRKQVDIGEAGQSIIDDLRAGRAKKEPPRFADVRQADVWKRMNDEMAEHKAAMDKAKDAGDYQGYQAAADKYDALRERIMRVAKQQSEAPPARPEPGSKPTGRFADPFQQEPLDTTGPTLEEQLDRAVNPRMTKDEATKHAQPVIDKLPPNLADRTHVHGDKNDALALPDNRLSPKAKQDLREYPGTPGGMFDPDTNTVHVFGDGHLSEPPGDGRPGGQDELIRTLAHELTHMGLRNILGDDYASLMKDVISKAQNRQLAQDIRWTRGIDPSIESHRIAWGDEYIAHLAENTSADPGLWRTVVDGVRRMLRKAGLVRNWTDDDIRDLIRRNNPVLSEVDPQARAGLAYKGDAPRFSTSRADDLEMDRKLDPGSATAIQYKLARTAEEQMDVNRGSFGSRSAWDAFVAKAQSAKSNLGEWARDAAGNKRLGWIGLRNLPDFMSKELMPDLHGFIDDHDAMDGMRGRLVNESADLQRRWSKWQAKQDDRGWGLSELMHNSTLLGHDPSKPYQSEYSPDELAAAPDKRQDDRYQRSVHKQLKDDYDKLDSEGKGLYNEVRDSYSTARQRVFDGLNKRIAETQADEKSKKQLMAELRQRFEQGRVKGVYFPLQRFGDRWGRAIDPATGEHLAFSRFENKDDQDTWLKAMRDKGLTVDKGQRIDSKSEMERIDPDFVKKIMTLAHDTDPSGDLEKEVWQTYLKAMPEMSMRKHFIMRQGRLGFSQDALRAFSYNSFHGSHQIARLEYGNRLDTRLQNVKDQARALEKTSAENPNDKQADTNSEWGAALAKELENRLDWIKNPRSSPWASNLTKLGFMWYLGAAPATAFRISTQNSMLAQPQIARHFGEIGATRELMRAVGQWAGARGKLSDKLRGDERAAFERAADMGMFSNTNTTMLASGGEGQPTTGAYDKFQRITGAMFNAMEHKNRMTTFLAAYRLGVKKGMDGEEAFKLARNITWDSHFDYNNANRPAVLQNDFAKVAGLFRQYAWGVTYRLGRDLRDSLSGEKDPAARVAAAHAFGSTMARMMLYAGVTGLGVGFPVYSLIEKTVNSLMSTKDTPYDMTAELHKHLNDQYGSTVGDSIMTGPIGAISGAALHSGASYNDMWYKPPERDMKTRDQVMDALGQFMGPIAGMVTNAATGADMMTQGHFERGLEHMLPPEAAGLAKSLRYSQEGVKNLKGDTVVDRKDLTPWDLAVQGAGFTPQKVADQYAQNTAKQNYIDEVQKRKEDLSNGFRNAIVAGDEKEEASKQKEIEAFNTAHPSDAITWRVTRQIRQEAKAAALAQHGVRAPKGLREETERKF